MSDDTMFPVYTFPLKNNEHRVIDGDTVEVHLDRGWGDRKKTALRLNGLDAPESRTRKNLLERQAGKLVTKVVLKWFEDQGNRQLYASSDTRPKYAGRTVGRIWAGGYGQCLNTYLVDQGLVVEYHGGKKAAWSQTKLKAVIRAANKILNDDAVTELGDLARDD